MLYSIVDINSSRFANKSETTLQAKWYFHNLCKNGHYDRWRKSVCSCTFEQT